MEQIEKLVTLGERRVRVNFNPSESDYVNDIKVAAAALIDLIDGAAGKPSWSDNDLKEWLKLKDLAMIAAEQSAMWAVKAATY
jgi:hypothetical protein